MHKSRQLIITVFMAATFVIGALINTHAQTLDPFNPNANVAVDDVEYLADGKILICGQFTTIGGQSRRAIPRLNTDGTLDTTFSQVDTAFTNILDAIIQPDGKILISGGFSSINGVTRIRIARLNADGTLDMGFDVGLTAPVGSSRLSLRSDGKILVPANVGNGINRVLLRNSDGSADSSFSSAIFNNTIGQVVAQPDGKVIVTGGFTDVDGTPRTGIARLNANGSLDTGFNANANSTVYLVNLAPDGKIYAGGAFSSIGGQTRSLFARLNSDGSADLSFQDPQIVGTGVRPSILLAGGKVLIAGSFDSVGGVDRKQLARLNANGTLDTSFRNMQVGVNSASSPLAIIRQADGKIVIGGNFVTVDGQTRNRLARVTPADVPVGQDPFDFDGDGKTDLAVYRPSNGLWFIDRSAAGLFILQLGNAADKIAPADFDGDGKSDLAVYRPSQGVWYQYNSATSTYVTTQFGIAEDLPVPGDYDGDGKSDIAVYRPSVGTWFVLGSSGGTSITQFGSNSDTPAPGDYDGDGMADLVVYRPSNGVWYERRSQLGDFAIQFGNATDKVAPADYDGDGKMDIGVYRASQGAWYSVNSSNGGFPVTIFGVSSDVPAPADYDGDGKADVAIYRPSAGQWWINRTTAGLTVFQFGSNGDKPVPNAFGN